jgi:putative transposase
MYRWRQLTDEQRIRLVDWRRQLSRPLHSPHHVDRGQRHYLMTGACFEHAAHIGHSVERMSAFTEAWLKVLSDHSLRIVAWVVLPNHYHALAASKDVSVLLHELGRLHGRTSFLWNGEEGTRGRKVWFNATETVMKSDAHYFATLNYVHHNPVKHGYAEKWSGWVWSSASTYLETVGRDEAERLWRSYPIDHYGTGRDDAAM